MRNNSESDYEEFVQLGVKLGIPVPQVDLLLKVEKNGKILSLFRDRSHTWNRNFWNMTICQLTYTGGVATNFGAGYLSFKTMAGTVPAVGNTGQNFNDGGLNNNSLYGILVGTGTTAESFEGFTLQTQCTQGIGANQLVHAAQIGAQNYVAGTKTWTITQSRLFNNNSASAIVIAETALGFNMPSNGAYCMCSRDLLGVTQNVPNGAQLTVSYDISLTFPG